MKYKVLLEQTEERYAVHVPGLPGCWSLGASEQEALSNIQDAVQEYLAGVNNLIHNGEVREVKAAG